ncbi:MAG: hypothetical protein FJ088_08420 [Deltaproteobacteria bacterium]|nr:hypothetical protein [Deltaproteobacteria bacterium]
MKPDKPATPIDAMFLDHERPLITRTFSDRKGAGRWTYIAAYHLASEHEQRQAEDEIFAYLAYDGKPMEEMFVFPKQVKNWSVNLANELSIEGKVVAYNWRTGEAFQAGESFALPAFPDLYDYAYFVFAPVFGNGIALIGETGKFVTMSDPRFLEIEESDDGVRVRIAGVPGEEVTIEAYDADAGAMLKPVKLLVGAGGEAEGTISR